MSGLEFTETMRGYFSPEEKDNYETGFEHGRRHNSPFEFTLTIEAADVSALVDSDRHEARMRGTVHAPALSAEPLTVEDGTFNLFVKAPEDPLTRRMCYRMLMTTADGRTYFMDGFKTIRDDSGFDLWSDTTTLFVTVFDGADDSAPIVGRGIVCIRPDDFMRQLTTLRVTGTRNRVDKLQALTSFGRFFGGALYDTYGGLSTRPSMFDPDASPRLRRPLRAGPPETYEFRTSDDVELCLTRYDGGRKGPVLLAHGFGVSSRIFTVDTIRTNLVEYLFEHGYDVWLLDYRVSIELASASRASTADDVATKDYPAAVEVIRRETGAESVQAVVHCYGATTFFMALLAGLQGVRSVVCSQVALHLKAPRGSRFKAALRLPDALDALGVDTLTAYVDRDSGWKGRLVDWALRLSPIEREERCTSPVCRRVSFLYGTLYEHDQLNQATHDTLHELFGTANLETFKHLTRLIRTGHLVSASGEDTYMPHLDRLNLPVTFLHGTENACFVPEGTQHTYDLLCQRHGPDQYRRYAIPDYGHIDCIFGKNAARDVYPHILSHLEATG